MTDAYLPALDAFVFAAEESAVVAEAMKSASPWDFEPVTDAEKVALKSAKNKILAYHLLRHGGNCCYCRTNLNGAGPYMTDREHVLPKGRPAYKPYSFTLWNLAAACKRCNMQFKKSGDSFVVDKDDPTKFESSDNYRFVHPNFDRWNDHLKRFAVQDGEMNLVKFVRKQSDKAAFTHQFFDFGGLEVDTFDQAQGLAILGEDSPAAAALRDLITAYRQ